MRCPEEELLLTWFEPCDKENATHFLNASQIGAKLAEKAKINLNEGTINKIGKSLKKHNFLRLMIKGNPGYALREFSWEEVDEANKMVKEQN